jgi:cold shock CspA family protein
MVRGEVKFWDNNKGWGALVSPEVEGDVWALWSAVESDEFPELRGGDQVEFDYSPVSPEAHGGFRWHAEKVILLSE